MYKKPPKGFRKLFQNGYGEFFGYDWIAWYDEHAVTKSRKKVLLSFWGKHLSRRGHSENVRENNQACFYMEKC